MIFFRLSIIQHCFIESTKPIRRLSISGILSHSLTTEIFNKPMGTEVSWIRAFYLGCQGEYHQYCHPWCNTVFSLLMESFSYRHSICRSSFRLVHLKPGGVHSVCGGGSRSAKEVLLEWRSFLRCFLSVVVLFAFGIFVSEAIV